jgi:GntR family transcriptional regulator, transcriptional repressor for pyruvate dehydrogenase complex
MASPVRETAGTTGSSPPIRLTRAEWLADTLQRQLEETGLGTGERIGTKADLRTRYDVAPGTVSQALRILKGRGLIDIRPGAHGGVFVDKSGGVHQPADVILGFRWADATFEQCREVRGALEPLMVVQAAQHRTQADVRELIALLQQMERACDIPSEYISRHFALHRRIGAIGKNRLLRSLYVTINDFFEHQFDHSGDDSRACRANYLIHLALVSAIADGDESAALVAAARQERYIQRRYRERRVARRPAPNEPRDRTRSDQAFPSTSYGAAIARQLEREISGGALLPGERIGTREDLRRRFDVSVGTINEAVRLAAARGLIVSRSGPGGGLFLAEASTRMQRSLLFAGYAGDDADTQDYIDLRDALEPLACRSAASNCNSDDANAFLLLLGRMRDAIDRPEMYMIQNWNLHRRVAQCVRNPLLHSMYLVVLDALEATLESVSYDAAVVEQHLRVHAELIDAIVTGPDQRLEAALRQHAAGPLRATHAMAAGH